MIINEWVGLPQNLLKPEMFQRFSTASFFPHSNTDLLRNTDLSEVTYSALVMWWYQRWSIANFKTYTLSIQEKRICLSRAIRILVHQKKNWQKAKNLSPVETLDGAVGSMVFPLVQPVYENINVGEWFHWIHGADARSFIVRSVRRPKRSLPWLLCIWKQNICSLESPRLSLKRMCMEKVTFTHYSNIPVQLWWWWRRSVAVYCIHSW